jgi:LmbE family N-acetylglucosaminyl deacetylase
MFLKPRHFRFISTGRRVAAAVLSLIGWLVASEGVAQTGAPPAWQQASLGSFSGSVETGLLLRQLDGVKRVLLIGAHPDDEDTALLASLARGSGAQAAYLTLTRGEGGQNLIGPELGEGLGLVRTGELLAARSLDGGGQYFTRAYDFGYSKSATETFRHWPRDSLLRDVVWVVRTFRPQIIVSIFSGTSRDGHGQHQVAGLLAREAFDVAGDPERFPEWEAKGVTPWQPLKLYRRTWRDPQNSTLTVATGSLDPLLGRSHHQIAMASRSQHRSQDFGTAQAPGPQLAHLRLLESRVPGPDTSLFAGVDTTLAALGADVAGPLRDDVLTGLARYREHLDAARMSLNALRPWAAAPPLAEALRTLRGLRDRLVGVPAEQAPVASGQIPEGSEPVGGSRAEFGTPGAKKVGGPVYSVLRTLDERICRAEEALLASASVVLEPRSDDDLVVPGQTVGVSAGLWNGGPFELQVERLELLPHSGAYRPAGDGSRPLAPSSLHIWSFDFEVPPDARLSEPYYLEQPRTGDLYRWPDQTDGWARPTAPPALWIHAGVRLQVDSIGIPLDVWRPVRYRGVDKASGEFWRPVQVVPALSVQITPALVVWPAGDTTPRALSVALRAEAVEPIDGILRLQVPVGWRSLPNQQTFALSGSGSQTDLAFTLRPESDGDLPATPHTDGSTDPVAVRAVATTADGHTFDNRLSVIDYSHIEPAVLLEPAVTRVRRFPVQVASSAVGYIMGSGDAGPEAIRQLGVEVEVLEPGRFGRQSFDRFDVLVLGVRTYEVLPELAAANAELLDWVRRGGVLIVQYNKYEFSDGLFAPYPIVLRQPAVRVTDEGSPVQLLEPGSPVLSTPNRITEEDFEGWIQERGLYFPSEWSAQYTPLLETGDPDEELSRGSLLVGTVGEGLYVYTSLSFFRQLPAGVPGAYRLLANLLSLDPAAWRAYLARDRQGESAGR